jgi:tetratricopeptide (TPR) repeat protein
MLLPAMASFACLLTAEPGGDRLMSVSVLYDQGRYQQAVDSAAAALADSVELDGETVSFLLTYRSFSLVALGREAEAEEEFLKLLSRQPKLELNPEFVSPKIIEVFKRARGRLSTQAPARQPEPVPIFNKPRPSKAQALWRSMLWPGWGQRHRGSRLKASVLQGASLGALGAWGALELGTSRARGEYLDGAEPGQIQSAYDSYNGWYRARNLAVNCVVAIWLYNLVDVMMTE